MSPFVRILHGLDLEPIPEPISRWALALGYTVEPDASSFRLMISISFGIGS